MKALLLAMLALPLGAQIRVTLEPQALAVTKRVTGSRAFGLWRVIVECDSGDVPRSAIVAATPISEMPDDLARDVMQRAARASKLATLGRAFDLGAPLAAQGLSGYAFASGASGAQWTAGGIALLGLLRNVWRGSAPDPAPYIARLLPERVPCGTEWLTVTGLVPNAARVQVEISPDVVRLEKLRQARIAVYGGAW